MSTLKGKLNSFREQILQNPNKKLAWSIIKDYISFYSAQGIKDELWILTIGTLSSDQLEEVDKGIDRFNRIFFYEHSLLFLDAINHLHTQHQKPKNKKAKPVKHE